MLPVISAILASYPSLRMPWSRRASTVRADTLGVVPDRSRRPRDPNQLAKLIVDIATGEVEDTPSDTDEGKNPAAVELGRKGGLKGGKARTANMTPEERSEAARRAAGARWKRKSG
jgi:hypothetical protein